MMMNPGVNRFCGKKDNGPPIIGRRILLQIGKDFSEKAGIKIMPFAELRLDTINERTFLIKSEVLKSKVQCPEVRSQLISEVKPELL
jgi:hypothetical protein